MVLTVVLLLAVIALLVLVYPFAGAFVVAMGVGNDAHFSSDQFRLERVNRLFPTTAVAHSSLTSATSALLSASASDPSWQFDTGDDSWLVTVATLTWNQDGAPQKAQWVIRYCLDWKWGEHFIEAASLNDKAQKFTPSLSSRGAIYGDGTGIPMKPVDKCKCMFY